MSKAEERALEAYPQSLEFYPKVPSATIVDFKQQVHDLNRYSRQLFQEGYEAAQKDLGWVSVKDRLPEKEGWYLVHFKDSEYCDMDYFDKSINRWIGDEINEPSDVDYWMFIPELPKEK